MLLCKDLKCICLVESKIRLFTTKVTRNATLLNQLESIPRELKSKLNVTTSEDWEAKASKQIRKYVGNDTSKSDSMNEKTLGCSEGKLNKNTNKPRKYWDEKENINKFLKDVKNKLNLITFDDWNSLTSNQIKNLGGNSLLAKYSLYDLKSIGFPEGKLKFKKRKKQKEHGFWDNHENVKQFLLENKLKLNIQTEKDWKFITKNQIQKVGGASLFNKYSIYDLKCIIYPEGKENMNRTNPYKSRGFWDNKENVKNFLLEIKEKLNLTNFNDWNSLTAKQINKFGGGSLFFQYSLYDLKSIGFPEGKNNFKNSILSKSKGYWDDENNVNKFIFELKEKLNLKTPDDWNLLNKKHIKELGAGRIFYKYSLYDIKYLGCPEGKNLFKKRKKLGFWDHEENINKFLSDIKEKLNLHSPSDWNRISKEQINFYGGSRLFSKIKMRELISSQNPDFKFRDSSFIGGRSSQRWLFLQIQKLFPHEEIVEDYFHSELSRETGFPVQFDIYLIERNIAIEYHGKHHYEDIPSGFNPLELNQNRDNEKTKLCKQKGIELIVIPYWWDNTLESLKEYLNMKLNHFPV